MFRAPTPVVRNILIINIAIFAVASFANIPLNEYFGLYMILSDNFAPYQFFTYMWLHGDLGHIFYNMLMVFFLGPLLEQVWGSKRFLIFYLVCGLGAGILYGAADFFGKLSLVQDSQAYIANPNPEDFERFVIDNKSRLNVSAAAGLVDAYYEDSRYESETVRAVKSIYEAAVTMGVMVGASGALYGLLFAFAYLFPNTEFYIYFLFPIKAKYIAFVAILYSIYSELNRTPGDNVAHLAHLSGMLIAFILLRLWRNDTQKFY